MRNVGIICGLILLTGLALGRVVGNDFINMDDPHYVTANEHVMKGLSWSAVNWAWTTFHVGYWMPLTWLSLQLDASLYWPRSLPVQSPLADVAAWGFHLTNLLLHLANTLLVYRLMFRLFSWRTETYPRLRVELKSFLVAALFGVHPLHVESVAWVTERKDVLSGFFGLLALLAYLRFREKPGMARYLVIFLCLALSLMAKPVLVTLPAIMLLLEWGGKNSRESRVESREPKEDCGTGPSLLSPLSTPHSPLLRRFLPLIPLFGLSLLITAITIHAQKAVGALAVVKVPFHLRLANAVVSYEGYLAKTFWPVDLACYYPHPEDALTIFQVVRAGLVLAGITVLAVGLRKKIPALLVGWLWFLIALTPNIGLIQAGGQGMADRFTYFALIGLFLALVEGGRFLAEQWRFTSLLKVGLPITIILILAGVTFRQAGLWQNCRTLYQHALEVTQNNFYVHGLLGVYLYDQNDLKGAEEELKKSLDISPVNTTEVHLYYGLALYRQGRRQEALPHLEEAAGRRADIAAMLPDYLQNLEKSRQVAPPP